VNQEEDLTNNPDQAPTNRAELEALAYAGLFLLFVVVIGIGLVGAFFAGDRE
jgi:hypothetical protein